MDFEELRKHEGETVELDGEPFIFYINSDLAGEWAQLSNEDWVILATLNYDGQGIPFDLHTGDKFGFEFLSKLSDRFRGVVRDWNDYISKVDEMFRKAKAKQNEEENNLVV